MLQDINILEFLIEISIFTGIYFYLLRFFHGTRGAQALTGFLLFYLLLWVVSYTLGLEVLNWAIRYLSVYLVVALVIIFAPEIRRALADLGKNSIFNQARDDTRESVDHVVQAVGNLAERKIGALIAIEREIGLRVICETGTRLDSAVTPELLASLFFPRTPLHDGGLIIAGNRIVAAGCVFPLTDRSGMSKSLGTRHRAAIGLSEESDAVCVVVSEETGTVSLAYKGKLTRGLDEDRLRRLLGNLVLRSRAKTISDDDRSAAPEPEEPEEAD